MKNLFSNGTTVLFLFCGLIVSLSGCYKDTFDFDRMQQDMVTWEPDLAIPLVNSTLTVEDVIGLADSTNEYVYGSDGYGADDFITLIYKRRVFSQTLNDIFQIPAAIPLPDSKQLTATEVTTFTTTNQVQTSFSGNHNFGIIAPAGSALNIIRFYEGEMMITVSGDFDHQGTLQVTFPQLTLNNVPLTQTIALTNSGGQLSGSASISIINYEMDLASGGQNAIPIDYFLTLTNGGGTAPTTLNSLNIISTFSQTRMAYAQGNFGQFNLGLAPNTVDVKIFENSENEGSLYFENPKMRIKIRNSFGVRFQGTVNSLTAVGESLGVTPIDYASVIPGGIVDVNRPNQLGEIDSMSFEFNAGNSNIEDIINGNYENFIYDMGVITNPLGSTNNFASINSALEVFATVELPFFGTTNHYKLRDTIESPLSEAADLKDNIEEALLRVNTVNGLPLDGILKLYLTDENYVITDSLLANGEYLVRSGPISEITGEVIADMNTNQDIPLDKDRVERLFGASHIIYAADLTSTDNAGRNIRIYGDDQLKVRIGIRVKLKASPSDLDNL